MFQGCLPHPSGQALLCFARKGGVSVDFSNLGCFPAHADNKRACVSQPAFPHVLTANSPLVTFLGSEAVPHLCPSTSSSRSVNSYWNYVSLTLSFKVLPGTCQV